VSNLSGSAPGRGRSGPGPSKSPAVKKTPLSGVPAIAATDQTRLDHLAEPLCVFSAVLGVRVWLVANHFQAWAVRDTHHGVPYLPKEISRLSALRASLTESAWPATLKVIHEAKKLWGSEVEEVKINGDPSAPRRGGEGAA